MNERKRVFFDIDGTMAQWKNSSMEELLSPGYFAELPTNPNVIEAVKIIAAEYSDKIELFSLSAFLKENPLAESEKNQWLDQHAAVIDHEHRVFCPCGTDKRHAVPSGIKSTDVLVDDYTWNLNEWSKSGKAIKLLNGINSTKGTWVGARINMSTDARTIAQTIVNFALS